MLKILLALLALYILVMLTGLIICGALKSRESVALPIELEAAYQNKK